MQTIQSNFKKNSTFLRLNKLYLNLLKTKHILHFFIGNLQQNQIAKLYKLIIKKQRFLNFLSNLEFRLEFLLLKTGIVISGKQAQQLILQKSVLVNNLTVNSSNFILKIGDVISVNKFYITTYKLILICNLFKTFLFFNFLKKRKLYKKLKIQQMFMHLKFPFFVEINFNTFTIYIIRKPAFNEFFFTKILSLYNCNQLYFII